MSLAAIHACLKANKNPLDSIISNYFDKLQSHLKRDRKTNALKESFYNYYNEEFNTIYNDFLRITSCDINTLNDNILPLSLDNVIKYYKTIEKSFNELKKIFIFNTFTKSDNLATKLTEIKWNATPHENFYDSFEISNLNEFHLLPNFNDHTLIMQDMATKTPLLNNFINDTIYNSYYVRGNLAPNSISKYKTYYFERNFTDTKFPQLDFIFKTMFNTIHTYLLIYTSRAFGISNNKQNLEFFCKIFPYSQKIQQIIPDVKITKREQSEPKKKRNFFGIELEFSCKENIRNIVMKTNQDLWYILKADSSLSGKYQNQAELVTVPMTLPAAKHYFAHFFKQIPSENFDNSKDNTNGIHIHISNNNFKNLHHRYMFKLFFTNPNNYLFIKNISERSEDRLSYCNFSYPVISITQPYRQYQHEIEALASLNRHTKILEETKNTIELRIFKGFANYFTVSKALDFTSSILEYTRKCEEQYKNAIEKYTHGRNLEYYLKWLEETPLFEYKSLKKTLKNKKDFLSESIALAKICDTFNPKLIGKNITSDGELSSIPFTIKNLDKSLRFTIDISLSSFLKLKLNDNMENILNFYQMYNLYDETDKAVKIINDFFEYEKITIDNSTNRYRINNSPTSKKEVIFTDDNVEKEELASREHNDEVVNHPTQDPWSV